MSFDRGLLSTLLVPLCHLESARAGAAHAFDMWRLSSLSPTAPQWLCHRLLLHRMSVSSQLWPEIPVISTNKTRFIECFLSHRNHQFFSLIAMAKKTAGIASTSAPQRACRMGPCSTEDGMKIFSDRRKVILCSSPL